MPQPTPLHAIRVPKWARYIPRLGTRLLLICLLGGGVNGCGPSPLIEETLRAQQMLMGMPKEVLFGCAGAPARSAQAGEREFFTYRIEQMVGQSAPATTFGGSYSHGSGYPFYDRPGPGFGYSLGVPLPPARSTLAFRNEVCEATFTVYRGRVERLVFGGGGTPTDRLETCYPVIENCLAAAKAQSLLPPPPATGPRR